MQICECVMLSMWGFHASALYIFTPFVNLGLYNVTSPSTFLASVCNVLLFNSLGHCLAYAYANAYRKCMDVRFLFRFVCASALREGGGLGPCGGYTLLYIPSATHGDFVNSGPHPLYFYVYVWYTICSFA